MLAAHSSGVASSTETSPDRYVRQAASSGHMIDQLVLFFFFFFLHALMLQFVRNANYPSAGCS